VNKQEEIKKEGSREKGENTKKEVIKRYKGGEWK
jgi:hypothetical protein